MHSRAGLRVNKITRCLYHLLPDLFCVSAANRKALATLHFYDHASVKVPLNFLQEINIDNGRAVDTDKSVGVHDFLQLSNPGRTDKLIILCRYNRVITRGFQVKNLLYRKANELFNARSTATLNRSASSGFNK